jgi:hypothetical protein
VREVLPCDREDVEENYVHRPVHAVPHIKQVAAKRRGRASARQVVEAWV